MTKLQKLFEAKTHLRNQFSSSESLVLKVRFFLRFPYRYLWFKLNQHQHTARQVSVTLFSGRKITVQANDPEIRNMLFFGTLNDTEENLTRYLLKTLESNDVFYDIGTNYGFYTALAEAKLSSGTIHSFEPNPEIFSCLTRSFIDTPHIHLVQAALTNTNAQTTLFHSQRGSGKSSLHEHTLGSDTERSFTVTTMTLNTYIQSKSEPTIIKLDVEGAEHDVIAGSYDFFAQYSGILIMEIWGGNKGLQYSAQAVTLLYELGYTSYLITEVGDLQETRIVFDAIFKDHDNYVFKRM
jgi:FkbM family methyltransferase